MIDFFHKIKELYRVQPFLIICPHLYIKKLDNLPNQFLSYGHDKLTKV